MAASSNLPLLHIAESRSALIAARLLRLGASRRGACGPAAARVDRCDGTPPDPVDVAEFEWDLHEKLVTIDVSWWRGPAGRGDRRIKLAARPWVAWPRYLMLDVGRYR